MSLEFDALRKPFLSDRRDGASMKVLVQYTGSSSLMFRVFRAPNEIKIFGVRTGEERGTARHTVSRIRASGKRP